MRALIFADSSSTSIAPLDAEYALATLPLAGKELIVYTVEDLVAAGVDEIVFVVADHADRIERLLGDGSRWGVQFRFVLGRGEERPSAVWPRVRIAGDQPLLVLRGDLIRSPAVGELMAAAHAAVGAWVCGLGSDPRGAVILLRPGHSDPAAVIDLLHVAAPGEAPRTGCVMLPGVEVRVLRGLSDYHGACLDLVSGRISGLDAAGRELALGLSVGLHTRVSPRSLKQGRAYVGDNARVHPEAELLGNVMIARDAVIDRAAVLYDCVILPHSYVGEMLEVNDAIVAGDTLMRVDTGVVLTIADAFLLGRLGGGPAGSTGPRALDRLLGGLLLILSLPLWPLAVIAAALHAGSDREARGAEPKLGDRASPPMPRANRAHGLIRGELLIGNRNAALTGGVERGFIGWRFNTCIPVLSFLPRLLAVVCGHLRLLGVSPLGPDEDAARTEDWQRVRDQAPVGLLGPTQLMLSMDAPLDERLMSDAFYVGQRGWLRDLRLLADGIEALFSGHAWGRRTGHNV